MSMSCVRGEMVSSELCKRILFRKFSFLLIFAIIFLLYMSYDLRQKQSYESDDATANENEDHVAVDVKTELTNQMSSKKINSSLSEARVTNSISASCGTGCGTNGDISAMTHSSISESDLSSAAETDAQVSTAKRTDRPVNSTVPYKLILFWNSFFSSFDYGIGLGSEALRRRKCPIYQCSITSNRSDAYRADVVLFHVFSVSYSEFPQRAHPGQIYVFFLYENPTILGGTRSKLVLLNDTFNLTFTYLDHPDTDIYAPLGRAIRLTRPNPAALPSRERLLAKSKLVLWIVSNCSPHSVRNKYLRELRRYVPVDVYGQCGNLSCTRELQGVNCIATLSHSYMFYLAFENAFCLDYYTEKVFNPLRYNMVPITLGGADYAKYLPPKSYINVREFGSVKELADRLLYLKSNFTEYASYFKWKEFYTLKGFRPEGFCRLCEILHTPNYPYKSNFSAAKYWDPETLCLNMSEQTKLLNLENVTS